MQTVVVTGGAGFVGSHLAILYKKDNPNTKVIALDNLRRRGSELNVSRLKEHGVEFVQGDVRSAEDLAALGHFNLMIECSAEPSVLAGFNNDPDYVINTNLVGTVNCLNAVRKNKADIIFLSTSRIYPIELLNSIKLDENQSRFVASHHQDIVGVSEHGISENFPLTGIRSLYGATKLCSELLIAEYISMYGIRGIINRCGVLTGPWQMGKVDQGVVVFWVAQHIYNRNLSYIGYNGSGKQVRDILHVDDLYRLLCLQIADFEKHNGQIYNVGGGNDVSISLAELTEHCQKITKNTVPITKVPQTRKADIPYYISDTRKVKAATGWKPTKSVHEILEEIARWITSNKDALQPILT